MSSIDYNYSKELIKRIIGENVMKKSINWSESDGNVFIERIRQILSENTLRIWFDSGLKLEYLRRFGEPVADNWIEFLQLCGRDVVEVEVLKLSNVSKTLIKWPISSSRKLSTSDEPMVSISESSENADKDIEMNRNPEVAEDVNRESTKDSNQLTDILIDLNTSEEKAVVPSIPAPILPPLSSRADDYFDCLVLRPHPMWATPSNFIVVPFDNWVNKSSKFNEMKRKMNEYYEDIENRIDLEPKDIKNGMFVAVKTRNNWFRMQIKSILSDNPFQAIGYLCDFGQHLRPNLDIIQPLNNAFMDLPAQAIRAELALIQPKGKEWDPIASMVFWKLVQNKPFVSTVLAINEVDGQPVLGLSLCDTSDADDVYIDQILVVKELAKPNII